MPDVTESFKCKRRQEGTPYRMCLIRQAAEKKTSGEHPDCADCEQGAEVRKIFRKEGGQAMPRKKTAAASGKRKHKARAREEKSPAFEDALSGLMNMGYKKREAKKALKSAEEMGVGDTTALIEGALKALGGNGAGPGEKKPSYSKKPPESGATSSPVSESALPEHLREPKTRHLLGQLLHASDLLDGQLHSIIETGRYNTHRLFEARRRLGLVLNSDLMPPEERQEIERFEEACRE